MVFLAVAAVGAGRLRWGDYSPLAGSMLCLPEIQRESCVGIVKQASRGERGGKLVAG